MHFTFDFSQNVTLPHFSRQIGPLYFLTLRKIQIFGVRVDSIPCQLNFLIDEDQTLGLDGKKTHGPDAVISMLDWALQSYESDAETCAIHADNCPGKFFICPCAFVKSIHAYVKMVLFFYFIFFYFIFKPIINIIL